MAAQQAYPLIGSRPINQIEALEVLAVLRKIEATGRYESARRMRSVISRILRYGIATGRAQRDVAGDLRSALVVPKTKHHAAITTPKEAGDLLRAIEEFSGYGITRYALRMTPHVFVRPGELRRAEWAEFDFERAIWSIPAEKMKMRWPHRVPLSAQVLVLLRKSAWSRSRRGRDANNKNAPLPTPQAGAANQDTRPPLWLPAVAMRAPQKPHLQGGDLHRHDANSAPGS